MKIFTYLFSALYIIGYSGNVLLVLYTEYSLLLSNWWNLINPFFQLVVVWDVITNMYFWIFLVITILGYFASMGSEKVRKDMN